jgi:hypothetical protein
MLFYLAMTQAGANFYTRYPDNRANLVHAEERPSGAWGQDRDRRRTLYSTFGLATLEIPVDKLARYSSLQLALDVHRHLWEGDPIAVGGDTELESEINTLLKELNLTHDSLGELFDPLHHLPVLPSDEDLVEGTLWLRSNRLEGIGRLNGVFQQWRTDEVYADILQGVQNAVRTELNRICGNERATGRLAEAIDHLIETRHKAAVYVCEQLEDEIDRWIAQTGIDLRKAETASNDPAVNGNADIEESMQSFLTEPPGRNGFQIEFAESGI